MRVREVAVVVDGKAMGAHGKVTVVHGTVIVAHGNLMVGHGKVMAVTWHAMKRQKKVYILYSIMPVPWCIRHIIAVACCHHV